MYSKKKKILLHGLKQRSLLARKFCSSSTSSTTPCLLNPLFSLLQGAVDLSERVFESDRMQHVEHEELLLDAEQGEGEGVEELTNREVVREEEEEEGAYVTDDIDDSDDGRLRRRMQISR